MAKAAAPRGWQLADEVEPPKGATVLVWNGYHVSLAKLRQGRFVAQAEGIDVCDPWEKPSVITGVTHWAPLPKPPAVQ